MDCLLRFRIATPNRLKSILPYKIYQLDYFMLQNMKTIIITCCTTEIAALKGNKSQFNSNRITMN